MLDVTKKLQAKDKHGVFAEPVTEAIALCNARVRTMDFRDAPENIRLGKYQSWDAFVRDVEAARRANAMAYNRAGTAVHALAAKTCCRRPRPPRRRDAVSVRRRRARSAAKIRTSRRRCSPATSAP